MNASRICRTRAPLPRAVAMVLTSIVAGVALAAPGDLDLNFGPGGVVIFDSPGPAFGQDDVAYASLPDGGGAALVVGRLGMVQENSPDMVILRVLADGSLDPTFSNSGYAGVSYVDSLGDADVGVSLARQPDGQILVAGTLESGSYSDWGVARFNTDGTLDDTFGEQVGDARSGFARFNFAPSAAFNDSAQGVAVQSNGRIVLAGLAFVTAGSFNYPRFALVGLDSNGDLDATFGTGGGVVSDPAVAGTPSEFITDIATRADGSLPANDSITLVGYISGTSNAVIRRYTADGTPDTSFDGDGTKVLSYAPNGGNPTGLTRIDAGVLQDDGKLVVVGRGGDRGFAFMRFFNDGTLDTNFGNNGRINVKYSGASDNDEPHAIALQRNGKIVASGYFTTRFAVTPDSDFAVVRLTPEGLPDASFGNGGISYALSSKADVAFAISVLDDGALLVSGRAQDPAVANQQGDLAIMRLQGDNELFSDGFEGD